MSLTSNMKFRPSSRFGFSKAYLAEHCPDYGDRSKAACYIPTRGEVVSLPADIINPVLETWLLHAPEPLRANAEQRAAIRFLLKQRRDQDAIAPSVALLERLASN